MSAELEVWRWSAAIQWASLVLIALFFATLRRSFRGVGLRGWALAWACNAVALTATAVFWWARLDSTGLLRDVVAAVYIVSKTAFGLIALRTVRLRHGASGPLLGRPALVGLGAYALTAPLLQPIELLGAVQQGLLAGLLLVAGLSAARGRGRRGSFLTAGLLIRGALAAVEAVVYAAALTPEGWLSDAQRAQAAAFLSAHSFLDTVAEWLLALAVVLALSDQVQDELRHTNADLLAAQADLRRLADRDPLTGLDNRRALPEILRAVQPDGAVLLFFDLDGFKAVNDRHGHRAGDRCLKGFAEALLQSFRPDDRIVRYGGDEFLVVAPGFDEDAARERLALVRAKLAESPGGVPRVSFSVGMALLTPGGVPELALEAADQAMYASRARRD